MEKPDLFSLSAVTRSAAALFGAVALAAAVWLPGAPQEAAATVEMTNQLTFTPDTVVVRAGETVEFRNSSALVHTVTGDPSRASVEESVRLPGGAAPFHSGRMKPGASFSHTFETPGTYRYFCVPHEGAKMRGTVIVEEREEGRS